MDGQGDVSIASVARMIGLTIAVGVGVLVLLAAGFVLLLWLNWSGPRAPLIDAAGRGTGADIRAGFDQAVKSRFPDGSLASGLILTLRKQGFSFGHAKGQPSATFKTWHFPCDMEYTVLWSVDDAGRLTAVSGTFDSVCL